MRNQKPGQTVQWIAGAVVLFASLGLEWYGRACGFLLTSDSMQYLSAAHSFTADGKFLSPDGSYYSYWPPLLPVLLSFFERPEVALVGINVICKITLVLTLLAISRDFFQNSVLKIIFLSASLAGVHLIMISVFIWSELIFMTLIFLNSYCALNLRRDRAFFYGLLATGFLACLQRNAGLFWISGVSVWLFLDTSLSWRARAGQGFIYFVVCTSGLWAWNIYNTFFIPADFSFYEHDFFHFALPNLKSTLIVFGKMILPLEGTGGMFVGVLFFLALVHQWVWKGKADRQMQFLALGLLFYTLGFLAMPGHLDLYEMDRYFSVITPIVYLFMMLVVQRVQSANARFSVLLYVIVFIWFCYPMARTVSNAKAWHDRSCAKSTVESYNQ